MPDFLDASLKPQLKAVQIHNSIQHIQLFLASILIIFLYVYCVYQFHFSQFSVFFNIWFISTEVLVSFFWLFTAIWFKLEQYQISKAHHWVQFLCVSVGCFIAAGIGIIYYYLPLVNPNFEPLHALTLSALLLIVTQTLALTFLTQRLDYFYLVFIPSIIPYSISQFILTNQMNQLFHLTVNFVLIVILLCANSTSRIHKRLSALYLRNAQLIKNTEQQVTWTEDLCAQLQNEMNKSKKIELQLQLNNQLLEQKIKERTFDIEQMNCNLENQQQNLDLAHEIAGLKPWDWNIRERHISVSDYQQQQKRKHSKDHRIQLKNIIHPDDLRCFKTALKRHLRAETDRYEATYRVLQNTGEWTWVHDIGRVIERDPQSKKPLRMVGIQRDIHRERTDQERLKLAASVLEQAAEGIFILDKHLRYVNVNPFYEKITGFHQEDCLGQHLFDISSKSKIQQQKKHLLILKQLEQTGEYDGELTEKFDSGKQLTLWLHINAIHDKYGRAINYIGIVSDLTERKLQEQRLSYLENYDTLTDLPNRFYYNYQLHQYLVSHQDSIQQLAVIRFNIDRFRPLNEYLSNTGGDELLRQVAQRLRLTNTDALFLAYLNGDDFAIVYEISHVHPSIQQHCERIQNAFAEPFEIFGQDHIITVSMGISFYPEHGRQLDYLNNCAEQALTEAKRLGGHTIKYYSSDNTALLEQGIYLERDLRQAIRNDELVIYYQPKIDFKDQHVYGFEALVRWNHPTKGIISPALFIPMAEKTSLISDIGRIVIHETAKQISYWNSIGFKNICVSFNVVAQQLQRGQLLSDLDEAIATYQISGESLELEITESSLIENSKTVKILLDQIKQRHINIALDDFGTGYSSLAYLADFPVDILKIDRSFIANIGDDKQDAIISAMIAMGKAMGLTVVAEGIETEQQFCYLKKLQCDIAQGYFFSKPLSEKNATEYLQLHKLIPS